MNTLAVVLLGFVVAVNAHPGKFPTDQLQEQVRGEETDLLINLLKLRQAGPGGPGGPGGDHGCDEATCNAKLAARLAEHGISDDADCVCVCDDGKPSFEGEDCPACRVCHELEDIFGEPVCDLESGEGDSCPTVCDLCHFAEYVAEIDCACDSCNDEGDKPEGDFVCKDFLAPCEVKPLQALHCVALEVHAHDIGFECGCACIDGELGLEGDHCFEPEDKPDKPRPRPQEPEKKSYLRGLGDRECNEVTCNARLAATLAEMGASADDCTCVCADGKPSFEGNNCPERGPEDKPDKPRPRPQEPEKKSYLRGLGDHECDEPTCNARFAARLAENGISVDDCTCVCGADGKPSFEGEDCPALPRPGEGGCNPKKVKRCNAILEAKEIDTCTCSCEDGEFSLDGDCPAPPAEKKSHTISEDRLEQMLRDLKAMMKDK